MAMSKDISILIVDDNEPIRMIIRHILENEGYKNFVEAGDGDSACRILQARKIDLIISDWNMPGMTGIELLLKVRADQETARTPFIVLSVEGLNVSVAEAFQSGANDFISKPFTGKELTASVKRVMGQTS
jgi:two-component system, chemotaxis family, chemotaxis protein CheY